MKKIMSFVFAAFFAATTANAAVLATEDFTYANGPLAGASTAWGIHSGTDTGSTPGDLLIDGGAAVIQHGTPSSDLNLIFASPALTSGVVTASFDIVVDADETIGTGGTDYEYFASFLQVGTFNLNGRVDVVAPEDGGDYTLGISSKSSTADSILGVDFNFGDTVAVVLNYDIATGIASLTAGGETEIGIIGDPGEAVDAFAMRQSDSSENETVVLDNLVITGPAAVPEPTSVALVLFGASAFGAVSMRRRLG